MKVFERREIEVCDFIAPHRVGVPVAGRFKVVLAGERMGEVSFKYLGDC